MHIGPNIEEGGLVFGYDTGEFPTGSANRSKHLPYKKHAGSRHFKGKASTNYIAFQNAVPQESYEKYSATSSGNWNANHPDAIRVYNVRGNQITGYVNTGVGDWPNTYHAHWQHDPELNKPVVVMNDLDGNWKAKSFGTGMPSWNSLGLTHGSKYTISWLQWVDHLSKNAKAGLYSRTTSGSNGFHDGQANSSTAYNTKLRTWQRVYQTYTTSPVRDLASTYLSIYMYGHYNVRGTVKIADVQIEVGDSPSAYIEHTDTSSNVETRSSTSNLRDIAKDSTLDTSTVSFDTDGIMTFDGTNDFLRLTNFSNTPSTAITMEAWIYPKQAPSTGTVRGGALSNTNSLYLGIFNSQDGGATHSLHWAVRTSTGARPSSYAGQIPQNQWSHIVGTYDGSTSRAYINGEQVWSSALTGTLLNGTYDIGRYAPTGNDGTHNFYGNIATAKIYNRALHASEVKQHFKASKNRFNL